MVATATAILHWNAIPVFADIDENTFNIDPVKIELLITTKTKAIIFADIFGQSADIESIMKIAEKYSLKVISDTAQSPGSIYKGNYSGTLTDIGGFSLNYHKHIHCGEGGLVITNNDELALKVKLIRNHGEAVIESDNSNELCNIIGHNFRLGEIEAAIAREQLKKLPNLIKSRQKAAQRLRNGLKDLKGLRLPYVSDKCTHVYYVFGMVLDENILKQKREFFAKALEAEGVPGLVIGYQNIHLNSIFRNRIAYGKSGFPWNNIENKKNKNLYHKGLCPIAENLHQNSFLGINLCAHFYTDEEVDLIVSSFIKIWESL